MPALILAMLLCPSLLLVGSARRLVVEGNAAYGKGKYDEALKAYDKASVEMPESPQITFNKGTAHYRKGDFAKATEAFEAAALKTKDLALETRCKFDLGNCAFREAERQRDSDLKKALDGYGRAVRHYQEALKLNPELSDAAHNIEVTRLLMKDLLDKLKKQQEKAKQQQQKQKEMLDKLKKLIERQQKANEQNKKLAEQEPKQAAPDKLKQAAQGLSGEQEAIRDDTKKLSADMAKAQPPQQQPNQPPPPAQQARQHLDTAATEQAVAAKRIGKQQLAEAKPPQEKALDELNKALAALTGQQQPKGGQDQKQQKQPQPKPQQQKTAKPRDDKARDILKEEKDNRERRRRAPGGYQRVDKDW